MQAPRVNAVGILESPKGYHAKSRSYPRAAQIEAPIILAAFLFVSLTTSVLSLAAYCLTSYAGVSFPTSP